MQQRIQTTATTVLLVFTLPAYCRAQQAASPSPLPGLQAASGDRPLAASPRLSDIAAGLSGRPLTIEDAVGVALATNRTLATAAENLYRIQGRTAEARAALMPTVGGTTGEIFQRYSLQPAASISATVPIDVAGQLAAATTQAQFQEVAARLEVNRARNQVIGDVKAAFYTVLRAKALVAVATDNLQNSLDRLKDANLRYQARAVAYFDVVRAQTEVANARRQVIQARNGVSLAAAGLTSAMGIEVTTPLTVSTAGAVQEPPGVAPPAPVPAVSEAGPPALDLRPADLTAPKVEQVVGDALQLGPDFAPLLKSALSTRPELYSADAGIAAARKGVQLARRTEMPQLGLSFGWFDFRNSTGTTRVNEPQARLQLVLPLFDGGLTKAREQQARGEVALAVTERRQVVDRITQEVEQAYLTQLQARDEVAVANQALSEAQQSYALAKTRYNAGVSSRAGISPLLEVSDAQAALTRAQTNQVNALYDYNLSRALLERAEGVHAYSGVSPGYSRVPSAGTVGRK